jgi:hypothetical protein
VTCFTRHQASASCATQPCALSAAILQVGYVALPSICGANSDVSWAVRGRLYQEAYMHGPLGASCSRVAMPCCIGSHYAVRTAALQEVSMLRVRYRVQQLEEDSTK